MTKKLPVVAPKDAVESSESNHVPVQRKRGRPRKVVKEELPAEENKLEEAKPLAVESLDTGKKRKRPKIFVEQIESGPTSKGGLGEEEALNLKVGRREGSRRKSEPRRAAGACMDAF